MPAVVPAASGQTPDGSTTTQVVNTDSCNAGDTLYIAYGTDAFDLAGMPEATSSAGALTAGPVVDIGTNLGHFKIYTVVVATSGVKTVTFPAYSGCDIHGHWVRYPESLAVDVSASNIVTTNTTSAHVAPTVDPTGVDRSLVCTWLTTAGPAMAGDPYVTPGGMTKQQETIASPFSDMCTATQELSADTPTGTRTATWLDNKRYGAVTVALMRLTAGGAAAFPVTLSASASGTSVRAGSVPVPLGLTMSAAGLRAGGAPVSDVLCGPWATPSDIPDTVKAALGLTDQQLLAPLLRASEILWMLAGRQWLGEGCTEQATLKSVPGQGVWPYHESWGDCGCWEGGGPLLGVDWARYGHIAQPVAIRLPRSPIGEILAVTVNAVALTASDYRLTRNGWLERVGSAWDTCTGDTVVSYTFGEPPPAGGRDSAVALAIELAKDMYGIDGCRLPKRTTSVVRQGVSITMADPQDFLEKGKTGLISVDLWLSAVNPQARPRRGGVWSPDVPTATRRRPL